MLGGQKAPLLSYIEVSWQRGNVPDMQRLILLLLVASMGCSGSDSGSSTESATTGDDTGGATTGDDTGTATTGDVSEPGLFANCPVDKPDFEFVDVGEVSLRVACQGQGATTLVMLHGFPDFWYGWKGVMAELSDSFRLIVPDQRGYNLSDKPAGLEPYQVEHLVADIVGLISKLGEEKVVLVGHDWGGVVAWAFGAQHPELLEKLIILNAPHPQVFARELRDNPDQQQASGYITFFMDENAEGILSANNYDALGLAVFNDAFSEEDRSAYRAAWGQPDALTAMLNWYRANVNDGTLVAENVVIDTLPTLVLWGMKDTALLPGNLVGLEDYITDLTIQKFENATHWIAHEEPAGVAAAIREFLVSE